MKKIILSLVTIISLSNVFCQRVLEENFDASASLPTGWNQYNVDNLTPNTGLISLFRTTFTNNAWAVFAANAFGLPPAFKGNVAVSISMYSPAGTSNDWLVTPSLSIPTAGYQLEYLVMSTSPSKKESYEIYVSTTGNAVANFTGAPLFSDAATPATPTKKIINLSAYAGQTIYIAFRNISNDKEILLLDDILVRKLYPEDVVLENVSLNRYALQNSNNTLTMNVRNDGLNAITSLTVNWNDGTDHSSVIPIGINPGETKLVTHPTAINYATVLEKNINITITKVNNLDDGYTTNNTASKKFNILSGNSPRRVVIEEGTGTWCGFCTRGAVAMEYMKKNHPDFIGIAVHNTTGSPADPMTIAEYDAANSALLSGFPGANFDRVILGEDASEASFVQNYGLRKDAISPATITATMSGTGNNVSIKTTSTFKSNFTTANYKLALVLVEDHVKGNNSTYNQQNFYGIGGKANGIPLVDVNGLNYNTLPKVIPYNQYEYNHVARKLVGGYSGEANTIPVAIIDGTPIDYTFTTTLDASWNRANMYAVVLMIDQDDKQIVNATKVSLGLGGIDELNSETDFRIFPNPATKELNLSFIADQNDYSISVLNLLGKTISTAKLEGVSGHQVVSIPLEGIAAGTYLITCTSKGQIITKQFVVQ